MKVYTVISYDGCFCGVYTTVEKAIEHEVKIYDNSEEHAEEIKATMQTQNYYNDRNLGLIIKEYELI